MCFKSIKLTVFIGILILPLLLMGQDNSVLTRIIKAKEIRVGTTGKQPPFSVKSKDGDLMGYEIELAMLLADAMKVKIKFIEKPFAELLPAMEKGEIDIIMSGMTMTPERNLKVAFIGPYIVSGKSILAKAKRLSALDEMDELNRPTISVVALEGSTSQQFVENITPKVKLVTTKDYDTAVKMVLEDKIDALVADYPICVLSILRNPDAGLATLDEPFTIEPIGMALPPKDFLMYNMIENYFNALQMLGALEVLEQKWFEDGSWLIRLP
jgi:polar amino acid transport system substrate-binding protein